MDCQIISCNKKSISKGLCPKHYRRLIVWGDPNFTKYPQISQEIKDIKHKYHMRKWRDNVRLKLFIILGMKCVKCGYSDIRALQFDHINGGGTKELRQGPHSIYKYYVDNPDIAKEKLQILCANCNWVKRIENREN